LVTKCDQVPKTNFMRKLLTALLLIIAVSCSKSSKDDAPEFVICGPNYPSWLAEKMKSLSNCECETAFLTGTYNGQIIIVQRLVSAFCCGYDVVYDTKGNRLFPNYPASNIEEYKKYLAEVTGLREIWRCSRPANL
jgi:hypothetical protein